MSEQQNPAVSTSIEDEIGLICLANPPVNALGAAVRQGLSAAVTRHVADPEVKVIVIYGDGRALSAGADIREFGKPPVPPSLPDTLAQIANCVKPVIVVMHGVALGGGLELALAGQVRVGLPGLRVSLPEVRLGLIPGAGGTQRLPRLTGITAAIDIICSGRDINVQEALALGILDRLGEGTPRAAGLSAAHDVLAGSLLPRNTDSLPVTIDAQVMETARAELARKRPALQAPFKALGAIAASAGPVAKGMEIERAAFLELLDGPDRQGLVHAFLAERATANIPESALPAGQVDSIGVIGGGTMGVGIATAFLIAGLPVHLVETEAARAKAAAAAVTKNLDGALKRGKLDSAGHAAATSALTTSIDLGSLSASDLVIEAVFEDMAVKTELFATLDQICKPEVILATNTSYLDINEIAAATNRPEAVIGLHFFSPAHVMRLLEIVVADKTAPHLVATAFALAKRLRKIPVRSGVCDGFIGNRILAHYRKATEYLVLDGASFEQVDRALEHFGFAMGPFAVSDLAGLDIGMFTRRRKALTRPAEERYSRVADRICDQGWFGRKAGQGFYVYDDKGGKLPNPGALQITADERAAEGISPRTIADQEIVDRCLTAMISEAARLLQEGIALRPIDVDAVELFGYGFPRHLGGPMNYADQIGAAELVRRIESYAAEDAHFWQVPEILRSMAQTGKRFADLNEG